MASNITFPTKLFINGEWRDAQNNATFDVLNPSTGEVLCKVAAAGPQDVDLAARAAAACFDNGVMDSFSERARWLNAIAVEIEREKETLAWMESLNMGKPYKESLCDVDDAAALAREYANAALALEASSARDVAVPDADFTVKILKEPVGPVAGISPWNYPLLMTVQKVFGAVAAGCPIVLKPSELAPSSSLKLAEIFQRVGVPAGVFSVVAGLGDPCGSAVASHPTFVKTAFTGSVATGKKVMASGAQKPFPTAVTLELGGKSPCVVFGDVDEAALDAVADWASIGIFFNSGQVCSATSRLIVHRSVSDKLVSRLVDIATKRIRVSDPVLGANEVGPQMGPLVSAAQKAKVLSYIDQAIKDGGELLCGGLEAPKNVNANGFFVQPTILKNVPTTSRAWREEIFGPVLIVVEFDTEEQALALANGTDYGLAASIFSSNADIISRMSRKVRAGTLWVNNNQRAFLQTPWGGFKGSGFGRELGQEGIEEYLAPKTVATASLGFTWSWYGASQ